MAGWAATLTLALPLTLPLPPTPRGNLEPLVSSQSMNDMLIINIIYTSKANFEVVKRREKLRFLTRESVHMKTLLTKVRPRPRLGSSLGEA